MAPAFAIFFLAVCSAAIGVSLSSSKTLAKRLVPFGGGVLVGVALFWVLPEMAEFFRRCGFPKPGANFIVIAIIITFVLGIVIMFGYAAIRPRFGPGPRTAIIAGLFAWFGVVVYGSVIFLGLGMTPTNVFAIVLAWELVEYLLATLVGAWLYKEA